MPPQTLKQSLMAGSAPKKIRMLIAGGMAPLPAAEILELLVLLLKDADSEVAAKAANTLKTWDNEELYAQLSAPDCPLPVLEYFSAASTSENELRAILSNPSCPDEIVVRLSRNVPAGLLEMILDNRTRVIRCPEILEGIRHNSAATSAILRLAQEIEADFLGGKKTEYTVVEANPQADSPLDTDTLPEIPLADLSIEGLPEEPEARKEEIEKRLSNLSVREKIKYALFGTREIRNMLIRDSNKEVAKAVLHSPKLTESEVETISSMRGVAEDILREIGQNRSWTKNYAIVFNLVKNPKTPPAISQALLFRLRSQDLTQITRDRSVPDSVRYNASRALRQRSTKPSS